MLSVTGKKEIWVEEFEAIFDLFGRGRTKLYIYRAGVGAMS